MAPPVKFTTEHDTLESIRNSKNNYGKKKWLCEICKCEVANGAKSKHLKSKRHQKNECPTCESESE